MWKLLVGMAIILLIVVSLFIYYKVDNKGNTHNNKYVDEIKNKDDNTNTDDKKCKNDNDYDLYVDNYDNKSKKRVEYNTLEEAIDSSKRVNFLVLGVEEDPRTDTIILASFDTEHKLLDLISIPRDTYYHVKSHSSGDHRKINAAYARTREKGALEAVENILNIPIHYYVEVKYEGVKKIVEALGGVEVYVPMKMHDIPKGDQVLNGEDAIVFLRFRKGYKSGDIGRVKAQQEFIKSAIKKSLSLRLPLVIKATFKAVKTDISLTKTLYYSYKAMNIDTEDITFNILPGKSSYEYVGGKGWSYYIHNKEETKEMIYKIYNVKNINE